MVVCTLQMRKIMVLYSLITLQALQSFIIFNANANAANPVQPSATRRYPGAYGDPHFTGFDGVNFDFTGEPGATYCMISDTELHINMKLVGDGVSPNPNPNPNRALEGEAIVVFESASAGFVMKQTRRRTWIKAFGILYRGHVVQIEAQSGELQPNVKTRMMKSITLDGVDAIARLRKPGDSVVRADIAITYESKETDQNLSGQQLPWETYNVRLGNHVTLSVKVSPEIPEEQVPGIDAFFHLSVDFISGARQHLSGVVHGILGQTLLNARVRTHLRGTGTFKTTWNPLLMQQQVDGPNGDGYLDGSGPSDYVTSGLLHSDCSFTRYNPNLADDLLQPVSNLAATVSSGYARRYLSGRLV